MLEGERFNFGRWQGEEIEWVCLEEPDRYGCVLALSTHGLEFGRPFDSRGWESPHITWEESEIRSWLNGEFYQNAFTSAEKKRIVTNFSANSVGNDTWDNVFLLSVEEVNRYLSPTQRKCYESDYAHKQSVKYYRTARLEDAKYYGDNGNLREMFSHLKSFGKSLFSSERTTHSWLTRTVENNGGVRFISASDDRLRADPSIDWFLTRPAICFQT